MDKRIGWLDVTRFFAILLVLIIHNVDEGVNKAGLTGDFQWYVWQFFHLSGRLGVPLFFMITGSLLLPRLKDVNIIDFYLKRLPQFALLIFFYTFLINIFHAFIYKYPVNLSIIMQRLSHGNTGTAYQLWFLYSIIGMYLVMPFLSKMVNVMSNKEIVIFILLSTLFFYLPIASETLYSYRPFWASVIIEPVNGFISYIITGYYLSHRMKINIKITTIVSLLFFALAISLYAQGYLHSTGKIKGDGIAWYSSLFIFFSSIPLYLFFKHQGEKIYRLAPNALTLLSKSSFCVFLLHLIPTWFILRTLLDNKINLAVTVILSVISSYLICMLVYLLFQRIPYLRKLVS